MVVHDETSRSILWRSTVQPPRHRAQPITLDEKGRQNDHALNSRFVRSFE
jgi:hypothetical protein